MRPESPSFLGDIASLVAGGCFRVRFEVATFVDERSVVDLRKNQVRPHKFCVKKTVRTFREEMLTCLRSGAPSLSILGKNVLFLAKFMQPVDFLCFVSFFHEKEMKSPSRLERTGSGGEPPKKSPSRLERPPFYSFYALYCIKK